MGRKSEGESSRPSLRCFRFAALPTEHSRRLRDAAWLCHVNRFIPNRDIGRLKMIRIQGYLFAAWITIDPPLIAWLKLLS